MRYSMLMLALLSVTVKAETVAFPPMPQGVSSFGAVVEGDYLYTYGGHSGKSHSYSQETTHGTFRRLNLKHPTRWEDLPEGPKVQGVALVAHQGKIYRIGGMQPTNKKDEKTNTVSQSSVSVYDIAKGQWTELEPMPEGRSSHDAVVVGDMLLVFGGWNMAGTSRGSQWHSTGLSLDLKQTNAKWKTIEQPFQRRALTMAAHDGKAYVICGLTNKGEADLSVNIYDPKSGKWSEGPKVPNSEKSMNGFTPAAAVLGDQLYLTPSDGKVYRMNAKQNAWEEAGQLTKGRIVARMVPYGNRLLVLGGVTAGAVNPNVESFSR